jgi:ribosomal protein S18 acetylase RimI-like enzyme
MFTITGPTTGAANSPVCESILRALPDWFGIEESLVNYVKEVATLPVFLAVAARDGSDGARGDIDVHEAIGLLSIKHHFPEAAEIHVIAVRPEQHGRGVGCALMRAAERWLAPRGIEYLQVKTLGPSRPCEHYDRTRRFYESIGFRALEEFKTLWNERNPCLVMVKRVSAAC